MLFAEKVFAPILPQAFIYQPRESTKHMFVCVYLPNKIVFFACYLDKIKRLLITQNNTPIFEGPGVVMLRLDLERHNPETIK